MLTTFDVYFAVRVALLGVDVRVRTFEHDDRSLVVAEVFEDGSLRRLRAPISRRALVREDRAEVAAFARSVAKAAKGAEIGKAI